MPTKIYGPPASIARPTFDFTNFDLDRHQEKINAYHAEIKDWLVKEGGATGPHTGRIYSEPVADGRASYMVMDGPVRKFALVHMDYDDGYQSQNVEFLPKSEIISRIDKSERLAELFRKPAAEMDDDPEFS